MSVLPEMTERVSRDTAQSHLGHQYGNIRLSDSARAQLGDSYNISGSELRDSGKAES